MATPFRLKRSAVSGKRPGLSDLQKGELALNFYDGHLYATRDTAGVGIGTTVSNLTPWKENFNNTTIHYENNVGIGTTNATEKLTIDGNLKLTRANDNAGLTRELTIEGSRGSAGGVTAFGKLIFNNVDANSGATAYDAVKLEAETTGNNGGELVFFTTRNSQTTAEEAVRINAIGKVGIGTNNPTASLEIHSVTNGSNSPFKVLHSPGNEYFRVNFNGRVGVHTDDPKTTLDVDGTFNVSGISTFSDEVSFGSTATFGTASQNIKIYTDSSGTPSSTIKEDGSGNLRILGNKIVFLNTADNRVFAEFNNGGSIELYHNNSKKFETTGYGITVFGGVNATGVSTFSNDVQIGTGGTTAFFDVSGGKLGIGVANPNTKLHIKGPNAPGIRIQDADGTSLHATFIENNGQLFINSRNNTSRGIIAFRGDNGTDVEEFMRITGIGSVGIGTDNPTVKLDVDGTINSHNDITINGTSVLSTAENDAVALAIALG